MDCASASGIEFCLNASSDARFLICRLQPALLNRIDLSQRETAVAGRAEISLSDACAVANAFPVLYEKRTCITRSAVSCSCSGAMRGRSAGGRSAGGAAAKCYTRRLKWIVHSTAGAFRASRANAFRFCTAESRRLQSSFIGKSARFRLHLWTCPLLLVCVCVSVCVCLLQSFPQVIP